MECFIIEEGVERRAELEDIFPMIGDIKIQYILRDAENHISLPHVMAHMPDEMKNLFYRNILIRNRSRIEERVKDVESKCKKDDSRIQNERASLISLIGDNKKWLSGSEVSERLVWKETKPKESSDLMEELINKIEEACNSGELYLSYYDTNKMRKDNVQKAFAAFQNRKNDLQKIRKLTISPRDLLAAALLFEAEGIEYLDIDGEFPETWPEFLEKCHTLKSIVLNAWKESSEFPPWIRNQISLRSLSIRGTNIISIPDWIGEMQSLTWLYISNYKKKIITLPDSIGNLMNLANLDISYSAIEKLPDSIGNLLSLKEFRLFRNKELASLPDSIGNLKVLTKLDIYCSDLVKLPDSVGNLSSLKELILNSNERLTVLPDSIGNLQNLSKLNIRCSALEKLPDSIGNLSSLKELKLENNMRLTALPDSMASLKSLAKFELCSSPIKVLPDCIGNLQSLIKLSLDGSKMETLPDSIGNLGNLVELSLEDCKNLKCLPESIGRLKNLTTLNICGSAIEKFPDTIADCTSLECVDVCNTNIKSFPDFISSIKKLKQTIEVTPKKHSISYRSFCNYYYSLVETIFKFLDKARREGILALEEELEYISEGFFRDGLRLLVDGTDGEIIRYILTLRIEHERDNYIKKLMEIAMEGILCIQNGDNICITCLRLAVPVDIKNNPLDAACAKYLACGDYEAFHNIDFKAALLPEEEREEIRFIKRAMAISEISRREGQAGIEKHLDSEGIAARDVFEYGLSMMLEGWSKSLDYKDIIKILTMLAAHETDPVRKNLALAKMDAVSSIFAGDNPRILRLKLLAYFDDDIAVNFLSELDD